MDSEKLADKVARAMFCAEHGSEKHFAEYAGPYFQHARVAVRIVVDEVCQRLEHGDHDSEMRAYAKHFADAILSLSPDAKEQG